MARSAVRQRAVRRQPGNRPLDDEDYEDCGAFEPDACPPMFLLTESDACVLRFGDRTEIRGLYHLRWVGNRLLSRRTGDERPLILAGRTSMHVQVDSGSTRDDHRRLYRRVARGLRSVSGARIGPPMLPAELRRLLPRRIRGGVRSCP